MIGRLFEDLATLVVQYIHIWCLKFNLSWILLIIPLILNVRLKQQRKKVNKQ